MQIEWVSLWSDEEYSLSVYHSMQDRLQWLYAPN